MYRGEKRDGHLLVAVLCVGASAKVPAIFRFVARLMVVHQLKSVSTLEFRIMSEKMCFAIDGHK